jgi:hypothetical protein
MASGYQPPKRQLSQISPHSGVCLVAASTLEDSDYLVLLARASSGRCNDRHASGNELHDASEQAYVDMNI